MRIDIITVLPEMIEGFFNCSIMKRAQDKGLAEIHIHNLRDYSEDKHRRVDDYPFGGFAGMVMKIEPIERCINALKAEREYDEVIFTTPDGEQFCQPMANTLSLAKNIIILCGHFKGIDYRIREHLITKEISIGDYVLTGGELAAAVVGLVALACGATLGVFLSIALLAAHKCHHRNYCHCDMSYYVSHTFIASLYSLLGPSRSTCLVFSTK